MMVRQYVEDQVISELLTYRDSLRPEPPRKAMNRMMMPPKNHAENSVSKKPSMLECDKKAVNTVRKLIRTMKRYNIIRIPLLTFYPCATE